MHFENNDSFSLKCNHQICKECYIEYINNKLLTEPINIINTPCPFNGCNLYLTRTIFKKCISEKRMKIIFAKSVVRNFTLTNKDIKLCPNPKCNVSIRVQGNIAKEIKCQCGNEKREKKEFIYTWKIKKIIWNKKNKSNTKIYTVL